MQQFHNKPNLAIKQCDQMDLLFFIVWLLTTVQIRPIFIKIAKVGSKFAKQALNKPS